MLVARSVMNDLGKRWSLGHWDESEGLIVRVLHDVVPSPADGDDRKKNRSMKDDYSMRAYAARNLGSGVCGDVCCELFVELFVWRRVSPFARGGLGRAL